jgi:cell wall-associated NlpC family hydrolase
MPSTGRRWRASVTAILTLVLFAAVVAVWLLRPVGRAAASVTREGRALARRPAALAPLDLGDAVCVARCPQALKQGVSAVVVRAGDGLAAARIRVANHDARRVVLAARRFLGVPYAFGGASRSGVDCSGLAMLAYRAAGIRLDHYTGAQWHMGRRVSGRLLPGDLVFFGARGSDPWHVGIYVGHGRYIHAPQTGDHVRVAALSSHPDYMGARRLFARPAASRPGAL